MESNWRLNVALQGLANAGTGGGDSGYRFVARSTEFPGFWLGSFYGFAFPVGRWLLPAADGQLTQWGFDMLETGPFPWGYAVEPDVP